MKLKIPRQLRGLQTYGTFSWLGVTAVCNNLFNIMAREKMISYELRNHIRDELCSAFNKTNIRHLGRANIRPIFGLPADFWNSFDIPTEEELGNKPELENYLGD